MNMNTYFPEMSIDELSEVLSLTIKKDDKNKIITFLSMLSAYTDDGQLNVSFNAPSSTGKSYISLEVAKLFPLEDVRSLGHTSPTAFFHDTGEFDQEKGVFNVNLDKLILIFIDQSSNEILERLRPILSHDQKTITVKVTDKTQKAGLKTKTVVVTGFPVVIIASAGMKIDEQEGTRFLLLSPETGREKLELSIREKFLRECDKKAYQNEKESNPLRHNLKERIIAIKEAGISEIIVPNSETTLMRFFESRPIPKPRHQRDIGWLMSIIKTLALLNLWNREKNSGRLIANQLDIDQAFILLNSVLETQEGGIPPYVYDFFVDCIQPFDTDSGMSYLAITTKYLQIYGRPLTKWNLRANLLPLLEAAGLIYQEANPSDQREKLVFCRINSADSKINSVSRGGSEDDKRLLKDAIDIFGQPIEDSF